MVTEQRSDPGASHFVPYSGLVWRLVESQNRISTDRLVDDPVDQDLLEALVEEVKPPIPKSARHLPTLLATPFRYWHHSESRFRRSDEKPGILYASEAEKTSVAETAYWRLKFLSRSEGVKHPNTIIEHTSFRAGVGTDRMLDLTVEPYILRRAEWTHPDDYSACQSFASKARAIDTDLIRYESVRDPAGRSNIAVFEPHSIDGASFEIMRSWHFRFEKGKLSAYAAFPSAEHLVFTFEQFGLAIATQAKRPRNARLASPPKAFQRHG
jgi:RES domain-containing protein